MKNLKEIIKYLPGIGLVSIMALSYLSMKADLLGIINAGALYAPLTTDGQWWRLLSSVFVHDQPLVFGLVLLCISIFSHRVCERLGIIGFWLIFLFSSLLAGAFTLAFSGTLLSFGSVAGVSGLLAATLSLPFDKGKFSGLKKQDTASLFYKFMALCGFAGLMVLHWQFQSVSIIPVTVGALVGFLFSLYLLHQEYREFSLGIAALTVLVIAVSVIAKSEYDYLPTYAEFQTNAGNCISKVDSWLEQTNEQKESKVLDNSSAMLRAVLKTQCRVAVGKLPQVEKLASAYHPEVFSKRKNRLLYSASLLEAEIEIIYLRSLKARMQRLRRGKKWRQIIEILESATLRRPPKIDEIIDRLKTTVSEVDSKMGGEKLKKLLMAMQYYEARSSELQTLRQLKPGKKNINSKLSILTARFEVKNKKCDKYVDDIEFEKSYYFPDYEKQLENILKEECRPALFISEKLVNKSLSNSRKRHWQAENIMVRKRIWRIHSTLEIIRLKEFRHTISKLKYEGDWDSIHRLKAGTLVERSNKIDILLREYNERFKKRATARDESINSKLKNLVTGYKGVNKQMNRRPASK